MTATTVRFETLIDLHHDEIYAYLWRTASGASRSGAAREAEDLTQEVFLRAYRAFARLRPDSNHRAWLYKIATNCAHTALSRARRQSARQVTLDDEFQAMPVQENGSPERSAILNETLVAIRSEIDALPPKQRAAVVLRHLQGLDYVDIAQALGCSEDSARANVYQGLRRLRRLLAQDWS